MISEVLLPLPQLAILTTMGYTIAGIALLFILGIIALVVNSYRKVEQGKAFIQNSALKNEPKVSFTGILNFPVIHKLEEIDIDLKIIEISRKGSDGLICKDNLRADIAVRFFIRVNKTEEDVKTVAQSVGCVRASDPVALAELFDAKFSEALKTVGKHFEFVELYTSRENFKDEIIKTIGTDLNGFVLDDAAIDYLEQTPLSLLDPNNILDVEGIKKITEKTAAEQVQTNQLDRDRERTIKKQDVEAREAILELERQEAEATEKQQREVAIIKSREEAEAARVAEEQRLRSEKARIATDEELRISEENKDRQILVAQRNKERTDGIEQERVVRDRELEQTEREKVVKLAQIEKEKFVEEERRKIQDVIKERVIVEKAVVEEQEKIKDTEAIAAAERAKQVAVVEAEKVAEMTLIEETKTAEAKQKADKMASDEAFYRKVRESESEKKGAELDAERMIILAEAEEASATRKAEAKKLIAEATQAETAAVGLGEVEVLEAKATAHEKQGTAEAKVSELKYASEAKGITEKAEAMKIFDEVGRSHEEFKLELDKDKEIELAKIHTQVDIAGRQADVLGEALRNTKVDIVGGNTDFFDKIVGAVSQGKAVDRMVDNSQTLTDIKDTFFNGDPEYFQNQLSTWVKQFGVSSEDVRNLSVAALLAKLAQKADGNSETLSAITGLQGLAEKFGLSGKPADSFLS
ncbi:MAG: flotillin family protein [Opitutales bacterium]